jgi:uncharacterized protein (DUF4415 family)
MDKKPPVITDHSDTDDAALRRAIADDPDSWEAPANAKIKRRGRPIGSHKSQVTIKLDKDVLAVLKSPEPKGWQTRLNATLRDALEL